MFIIYKSINRELERKAYSDIAYFERCEWQVEIDRTINILNFAKLISLVLFIATSLSFILLWY